MKLLISGGGTGGHIFPALAIAKAFEQEVPDAEILFVGATGKMEMQKVPQAGYRIKGLPIRGFQRGRYLQILGALFLLVVSLVKSYWLLKKFKPDAVVGVGGFASGAIGFVASKLGIPLILQEQNSYAGLTNKLLAKKAASICVAYPNLENFFPKNKIVLTGNPIRKNLLDKVAGNGAFETFNLQNEKKTLLILGGSLGAKSINQAVLSKISEIASADFQILWQVGKLYYSEIQSQLGDTKPANLELREFITDMNQAYSVADLVLTRAGAGTISELSVLGVPCVLVPSPNVADDHQTKNALAVTSQEAGLLIQDKQVEDKWFPTVQQLLREEAKLQQFADNIKSLGFQEADKHIVAEILKHIKKPH